MGKPCNMKKYKKWLRKIVERYDDDGVNDMPGLKYPIRHYIIGNEPDVECEEDQCFFDIKAKGYAKLLRQSYKTIKKQSSKNQVIIAAPSTMGIESRTYYRRIFRQYHKKYFDYMNYHAIDPDAKLDLLGVRKYNKFARRNKLLKKPVFAGEWEVDNVPFPRSTKEFKMRVIRSTAYALTHGIDVICFIGGDDYPKASKQLLAGFFNFAEIDTIYHEEIKNKKLIAAKYKFKRNNGAGDYYLAWDKSGELDLGLEGEVLVTDKNDNSVNMNAEDIVLTKDPIFIEDIQADDS